jgi:hypothetical protein
MISRYNRQMSYPIQPHRSAKMLLPASAADGKINLYLMSAYPEFIELLMERFA